MGHQLFDGRFLRERMDRKDRRMEREQAAREDVSDHEMADAMQRFGGSFVALLGHAWQRADPINRAKLLAAFPEYAAEYRDLARLKREQVRRG